MPVADGWDPEQYHRFERERSQAFFDLLDLIEPAPGGTAVDLGCGSGELTVAAAQRLRVATMTGVDTSPAMLARAAEVAGERRAAAGAEVHVRHGDIGSWTGDGDHDVVLANASLQWVPDHPAVLARWAAALAPGGRLAVQVPFNPHQPSHAVATEVAASDELRPLFGDAGPPPDPVAVNVLEPEAYAEILHDLGLVDLHVRLQVYPHLLPSTRHVVAWVEGTTLTRFRRVLTPDQYARFVRAYEARLVEVLGERSPCLFPFRRILFRARRPG